jgi:hypothetical protein
LASFASLSAFPAVGDAAKVFLAQDTGDTFRWDGAKYVRISERVLSAGITDSTVVGRKVVTAVDETAGRTALVAERHRTFNVLDYGAVGDGVADDTAAVNAARNAAGVGGVVLLPKGTYKVSTLAPNVADQTWRLGAGVVVNMTTRMNVSASGVTILGAGRGVSRISSAANDGVIQLSGESDISLAGLTFEATASSTTSIGIQGTRAGLQKRVSITGCRIVGTGNNAVRFNSTATARSVEQFTFSGNIVEDCTAGLNVGAPPVASGLISSQIKVTGNYFRRVGTVNIQFFGYGSGSFQTPTFSGVEVSGNDLRDFAQLGAGGPIPIEVSGVKDAVISNNVIATAATRGISMANNINTTVTGNVIRDQSIYAFELNGGKQISIIGNTVERCATFAMETATDTGLGTTGTGFRLSDVVIANNLYVGSGWSSTAPSFVDVIRFNTAQRVRVSGNVFNNWQFLRAGIRIGNSAANTPLGGPVPEDCVVEGNTFFISDPNTTVVAVDVVSGVRTSVLRNTVRITRNLVAADVSPCIAAQLSDWVSDTTIEGNHIQFEGTVAAAPTSSGGVGSAPSGVTLACSGLTVRRNTVVGGPRGLRLLTDSPDLLVHDNETANCVNADVIPATAQIIRRFDTVPRSSTVLSVNGTQVEVKGHTHVAADVVGAQSTAQKGVANGYAPLDAASKVPVANLPARWVSVPASATAPGVAGDVAYNATHMFVCVATNTWTWVKLANTWPPT